MSGDETLKNIGSRKHAYTQLIRSPTARFARGQVKELLHQFAFYHSNQKTSSVQPVTH